MEILRTIDRIPLLVQLASILRYVALGNKTVVIGGVSLSQRLILAAGLVKGDEYENEKDACQSVADLRTNIMPGWRIVPAIVGPVEFGSFTRHPRLRNSGEVVWRHEKSYSTQNRFGLPNPGARAAASFLGNRRHLLPTDFGINIALTPELHDINLQKRHVMESLNYFLAAGISPSWFTLNLSCPNTEDDPIARQLESETRQLCRAFIERLRESELDIPLWVKISPGLVAEQYRVLMRVFNEVGVSAVIATNTVARPSPKNNKVLAGVGGGELFPDAFDAVFQLLAEKKSMNYEVDVIACGGILDGASFRKYLDLGVKAAQYWSALIYRGPFAAAIIENELATHESKYEAVQRESLA